MANFNVRGGVGTQIISVMMAYAIAHEYNEKVEKIFFNVGNYSNPLTKDINIWFLDDIITYKSPHIFGFSKPPEIIPVIGQNKIDISAPRHIKTLARHINVVRKQLKTKMFIQNRRTVLHMRGLDRAIVPKYVYDKIRDIENPGLVLSDDDRLTKTTGNDAVSDWKQILCSRRVIGGYSNYTISSALLNPKQSLEIIGREHSLGKGGHMVWKVVDRLVDNFPNIKYYEEPKPKLKK